MNPVLQSRTKSAGKTTCRRAWSKAMAVLGRVRASLRPAPRRMRQALPRLDAAGAFARAAARALVAAAFFAAVLRSAAL